MTSQSPNSGDWRESLEVVVSLTRHERFRWLCSEENTDAESREGYRAMVVGLAASSPPSDLEATAEDLALRKYLEENGGGGCCG